MALTEQKRRYAAARLAGLGKKAAAIEAGCPEKTAAQAASRYTDPKLRLEAGKAWAAYTVSKPGEKGKKEEREEAAAKASGGRFSSAPPPPRSRLN